MNDVAENRGRCLRVLGVAEPDPPCYPWRALRAILAEPGDAAFHLWTDGSERDPTQGAELPPAVFEARVAEGLVERLPTPLELQPMQVVVRSEDGRYRVRPSAEVTRARRAFLAERLRDALAALDAGDIARAAEVLELARLAEDFHPMATVVLGGLALEHAEQSWAETVIHELRDKLAFIDLDAIQQSVMWEGLPHPDRRQELLGRLESFASACRRPPPLADLYPVSPEVQQRATLLLTARRLLPRELPELRSIGHRRLKGLVRVEAKAVEQAMRTVCRALGRDDQDACLDALRRMVEQHGSEGDATRRRYETRVRLADWERQAQALARLELSLHETRRHDTWKGVRARLQAANPRREIEPWRAGETAARVALDGLLHGEDKPPEQLGEWALRRVGLAATAAEISDEEIDACHVVHTRVPPVAYLDRERIMARGLTTRFAIAKSIGYQAVGADWPGAHLSHTPTEDSGLRDTTELEQAANGFAIYFIAPRESVIGLIRGSNLGSDDGYATATEKVMNEFGLTFAAAFAHVANCNQRRPEYSRYGSVGKRVQHEAVDRRWLGDRLPVAQTGAAEGIPTERTNGFASLLERAVQERLLDEQTAENLLGGSQSQARRLLRDVGLGRE